MDVPQLAAAIFGGRAVPSLTVPKRVLFVQAVFRRVWQRYDALHKQDDAAIAAVLANAKAPLEHMQLFTECAPGSANVLI